MLDIETLDTKPTAVILSIGAVCFDLHEPDMIKTFYEPVSRLKQVDSYGRTMSHSTLDWWAKQSDEAKVILNHPDAISFVGALTRFKTWLDSCGDYIGVHGNGSDFDNVILASAYDQMFVAPAWDFRKNRCHRTLKSEWPLTTSNNIKFSGVAHNSLDDAVHQVREMIRINQVYNLRML